MKYDFFNYEMSSDCIRFWCTNPGKNYEAIKTLDDFMVDISIGYNVFVHCYRLPPADEKLLIDSSSVKERLHQDKDYFNTFFSLSEAKIRTQYCDLVCEFLVYLFKTEVTWLDYLSMPVNFPVEKAIKSSKLMAYFSSLDQGADFRFLSCKSFEPHVRRLIDRLSSCGYVRKNFSKNLPYDRC
jgi:hypothetical protein